ncbi:hypothetical protein SERLA73DRAFT_68238 [Serpula lacrymans var. lacrymans S7.3]|uniref:Uncharacterized protein n=1 Tax=Serpula lacrymans var. lacrymans (strain S7.3) TaxID=936435 RepID=F8PHS0_SERL3|nr:hypothetical protein SERLA73DRAFT_68238 [Serpula lacrymans var. lacrymans S7.3]
MTMVCYDYQAKSALDRHYSVKTHETNQPSKYIAIRTTAQHFDGGYARPDPLLIPAPRGPLSKPSSGGYTLSNELKWDRTMYIQIQEGLHELCKEHLETTFPYCEPSSDVRITFLTVVALLIIGFLVHH